MDRRVRRTKRLLKDALVELTLERGYDDLTIQDITDRADIGYRTFFRHYADKDELLHAVLESLLVEIRDLMAPPPPEIFTNPEIDIREFTDNTVLFNHVKRHCDLYRVFMRSERQIVESVMAFSVRELKKNIAPLSHAIVPLDIVANHVAGATIVMVRWWLDNGMKFSPEEMAEYHTRLILQPLREMVLNALRT